MSRESVEQSAVEYAELCAATGQRLDALAGLPPGPELIAALTEFRGEPLDAAGAVVLTGLWDKVSAWVSAQGMVAMDRAVQAVDTAGSHGMTSLIAELAVAGHVSEGSMSLRVGLTTRVADALPLSWEALNAGTTTLAHVKALDGELTGASSEVARVVEAAVLPAGIAAGWTPHQVRLAAGKALLRLDPDGCAERAEHAKRSDSDVTYRRWCDGLAQVTATGDELALRQVQDAIDAKAAELRRGGDTRPVGLRRIDALLDAVLGPQQAEPAEPETADPQTPEHERRASGGSRGSTGARVEVGVTIDWATLLGLADNPGEVAGVGPVSAETVRRLARDAVWRRLITDPVTGRLVDVAETGYRPSVGLRRLVDTAHRTCRFPGCARRAIQCDCDHRKNWPHGPTVWWNLHPLCRKHHNLKTARLWSVEVNSDGSQTWTSGLGFSYTVPPARYSEEEWLRGLDPPDDTVDIPEPEVTPADPDPPPVGWWETIDPPPLRDDELEAVTRAIDARFFTDDADYDPYQALEAAWERIAEEHYDHILQQQRGPVMAGELSELVRS